MVSTSNTENLGTYEACNRAKAGIHLSSLGEALLFTSEVRTKTESNIASQTLVTVGL